MVTSGRVRVKITVPVLHTVRSAGASFFFNLFVMDKKPKSIETQIQLLKYRGMILKDESTYENMGYKNCLSLMGQGMPCPHRLRQNGIP